MLVIVVIVAVVMVVICCCCSYCHPSSISALLFTLLFSFLFEFCMIELFDIFLLPLCGLIR